MRKFFTAFMFALSLTLSAQVDECKYTVTSTEEGQEIKTTREYLMYEKIFAGTSQFIFFSLSNNQGVPVLNFQLLAKNRDFVKAYCMDKASRIYLQLENGKIVTLICAVDEQCSSLVYDSGEQNNIGILTVPFFFTKGAFEDLDKSPVSFIRIKYATDTQDYITKKELKSESMLQTYYPEKYFINTLKCIQ